MLRLPDGGCSGSNNCRLMFWGTSSSDFRFRICSPCRSYAERSISALTALVSRTSMPFDLGSTLSLNETSIIFKAMIIGQFATAVRQLPWDQAYRNSFQYSTVNPDDSARSRPDWRALVIQRYSLRTRGLFLFCIFYALSPTIFVISFLIRELLNR